MAHFKLYGQDAKLIDEEDKYKVIKYTIEGRTVAELIPLSECCSLCESLLKSFDDGHGGLEYYCSNKECEDSI